MQRYTDRFEFIESDFLMLYEEQRKEKVRQLQKDLYEAAKNLGQTDRQAVTRLDELFSAYPGEWSIFILTGATAIVTAIQNDATLPWLNTLVGGLSIRQRLINRLS